MAKFGRFAVAVGALAFAAAGMSATASADEERKFDYTISMTATSDYIFRGISLTNGDPAFQPSIELRYGIAYVGLWGSNIDGAARPFEMDVTAGIRPVTGPVSWDIGVLWYTYPDSKIAGDLDYVEFKVAASITPVTNLTMGVTGYFTPNQGFAYPETETIEGNVSYQLPQFAMFTPTIGGIVGYSTSSRNSDWADGAFLGQKDYTYWNAGLKLAVDKFFMDFRYWDTNIGQTASNGFDNGNADSRFVFSAGVSLP
ncbi:hypothetical protein DLM45_13700 [Hyphomicrobium methylovorum]|uniref:TorF family putative porin n=1 Tax=Hyphomicrobium methylovorum TaxID=84 RepID=UPI0015E6CAB8|nr:TorF family putative porin [Hyphomicrobium methylovorum]MBA2127269.1 hypothetical protein [Hyphomicrobium methylovorum]